MKILVEDLRAGDMIPAIDGYVAEVEEGNGYLSYPSTSFGQSAAMPADTIVVTLHDCEGNENYMLFSPETEIEVERD